MLPTPGFPRQGRGNPGERLNFFPGQDLIFADGGAAGDRDRRQVIVLDLVAGGEIKTAVSGNISLADNGAEDAAGPILNKTAVAPESPIAVAGAIHDDVSQGHNGRADGLVGIDLGRAVNGYISGGHDGAVHDVTVKGQISVHENDLIPQVAGAVVVKIALFVNTRGPGSRL